MSDFGRLFVCVCARMYRVLYLWCFHGCFGGVFWRFEVQSKANVR